MCIRDRVMGVAIRYSAEAGNILYLYR